MEYILRIIRTLSAGIASASAFWPHRLLPSKPSYFLKESQEINELTFHLLLRHRDLFSFDMFREVFVKSFDPTRE
jgi:hypothetical protein